MPRIYSRQPIADRFWAHVRKDPDGCWLWQAGISKGSGYGNFKDGGRTISAHRKAWELTYGDIPPGSRVLHRCDIKLCCRPDHLFLGSALDNMQDMISKGRQRWAGGAEHPSAKLSPEQLEIIKSSPLSGKELASILGVHPTTITRARGGVTYKS